MNLRSVVYPLALCLLAVPVLAADTRDCAGSLSIGTFRLSVEPDHGGPALPLRSVNQIRSGQKLIYQPLRLPDDTKDAEIAAILLPEHSESVKDVAILDPAPAHQQAIWNVQADISVVALIYGPQGLNMKKVKSLVTKNQEVLTQLADYAQQTSQVEALVQVLAASERSGGSLQAALSGFSSQYGVALPRLDKSAPTDQQAGLLLKALMPAVNSYDPLSTRQAVMQQSAGLAASVASLFFGSPVGLAAGGASLFQNMRSLMFPDTDFRSAFAQLSSQEATASAAGLALCAKPQPAKSRTRVAYLWAHRVPNLSAPQVSLAGDTHLPVGSRSVVRLQAPSPAAVKNLGRARAWELVPEKDGSPTPVSVVPAADGPAVEIDLAKSHAEPGQYRLMAYWDWDKMEIPGRIYIHPYGKLDTAQLTAASRDRLAVGNGRVQIQLTGPDFQFVDQVALEPGGHRGAGSIALDFKLPKGSRAGEQHELSAELDTNPLEPGAYRLLLAQSDGGTHEIPLTVLPPNPKIEDLPLRINEGDREVRLTLRGGGLDRIESIETDAGTVALGPAAAKEREATVQLAEGLKKGQRFGLKMKVQGMEEPLPVENALRVAGPRPRIVSLRKSFPQNFGVTLLPEEIPSGSTVSFAISVQNVNFNAGAGQPDGGSGRLEVSCATEAETRKALDLAPGDSAGGARLNLAGENLLFLSIDPGAVGNSGCELMAAVESRLTGRSDPQKLGRVVRVPRIEQFVLTDEKVGDSVYAGTLKGEDLDTIEKTGWDSQTGLPVLSIPTPIAGDPQRQMLKVALPWPAPSPHAPVFVWLRGEQQGRATGVKY